MTNKESLQRQRELVERLLATANNPTGDGYDELLGYLMAHSVMNYIGAKRRLSINPDNLTAQVAMEIEMDFYKSSFCSSYTGWSSKEFISLLEETVDEIIQIESVGV